MREWFAPGSAGELLRFRSLVGDYEHVDVLRIVLARAALAAYADRIAVVLERSAALLPAGAPLLVVNDDRGLYPDILERAGVRLDGRHRRDVNRRTGRRAGKYLKTFLIARHV